MEQRKYEFVGAGLYPINHMGLAIYIKYKSGPNEVRLVEQSSRHVYLRCPDRELYLVNDKHTAHPYQVPFEYDEVVNVSPFWPTIGANLGITNYMMNYSQMMGKEERSPKLRLHGRQPHHNQMIYADSGGFQLKSGKYDYINPRSLTEWYNENVDIGMVLDIPSSGYYWEGLLEKMAKAQRSNIDIMLAHKRPDLHLMNIFHGDSLEAVNKFRSIVETDEIDRVSIGGAYYQTLMNSIDIICRIMTTGRQYKHYHALGVGNIRQIYPLMRMASKGIAPYITSDASTFLQEAMNKGYFLCPSIEQPPRHYVIGDMTNKPNAGQTLPCSCAVCSAIKYMDVLNSFTGNILAFLLMYHNLFRFTQHTQAMYDIIDTATKDDLKALLRSQFQTRRNGQDETLACIDYVDAFADGGADYAARTCAYFLTDANGESELPSLFGASSDVVDDEEEPEVFNNSLDSDDPIRVRMERVLDSFINQSDSEKKHVKIDKKKQVTGVQGHQRESSGFVALPGKHKRKKAKKVEVKVKLKQDNRKTIKDLVQEA